MGGKINPNDLYNKKGAGKKYVLLVTFETLIFQKSSYHGFISCYQVPFLKGPYN